MLTSHDVEQLNEVIQDMDRDAVARQLQQFKCRFPIDFTPDFFAREPLPRLRHILFGLCLHNQKTLDGTVMPTHA